MTAGLDLLTEIATDVRYIKESLANHILHDELVSQSYVKPLWEAHQQAKGAAKLAGILWALTGGMIVGVVDYFTKVGH